MINRELMGNQASHDVLNKILRAQLELLQGEVNGYLAPAPDGSTRMPHEWGSIDSYDDMRNATDTALTLLNKLQDAMFGEPPEEILAYLREHFTEVFFGCTIAAGVEDMLGVSWEAEIEKGER